MSGPCLTKSRLPDFSRSTKKRALGCASFVGVSSGANSLQGPSATLGVSLATTGSLAVQAAAKAPVIYLRVVGSQNGSIDCDPNQPNLRTEIGSGCVTIGSVLPDAGFPIIARPVDSHGGHGLERLETADGLVVGLAVVLALH